MVGAGYPELIHYFAKGLPKVSGTHGASAMNLSRPSICPLSISLAILSASASTRTQQSNTSTSCQLQPVATVAYLNKVNACILQGIFGPARAPNIFSFLLRDLAGIQLGGIQVLATNRNPKLLELSPSFSGGYWKLLKNSDLKGKQNKSAKDTFTLCAGPISFQLASIIYTYYDYIIWYLQLLLSMANPPPLLQHQLALVLGVCASDSKHLFVSLKLVPGLASRRV